MNAGDRTRVARVGVAQVVEGFFSPQFCKQNSVRLHPQAGFQELLRRHARQSLIVFGIEEAHMIRVPVKHQLPCILDGNEALVARNLAN